MAGLPATYTFTAADAGSHEFTGAILETAGSQTITAADSANDTVTGTSPRFTVNAADGQPVGGHHAAVGDGDGRRGLHHSAGGQGRGRIRQRDHQRQHAHGDGGARQHRDGRLQGSTLTVTLPTAWGRSAACRTTRPRP